MPSLSFDNINALEEFYFIGGNEYNLEFEIKDPDGNPVDLQAATCGWSMCYYGQPDYAVLTKEGVVSTEEHSYVDKNGITQICRNVFTVTIESADTKDISGKFIHQPIVVDYNGSEFRPAQGIITIIPRINSDSNIVSFRLIKQ